MSRNAFKNKSYWQSLKHAWAGLVLTFKNERNFRIQLGCLLSACLLGGYFHISLSEWLSILFAAALVLFAELHNTVIESLVDLHVGEYFHPLAKKCKDVAAAAVLLTAMLALLVGLFIFIPKFWALWEGCKM